MGVSVYIIVFYIETAAMKNHIELNGNHESNPYLQHFKIARFNLRLVIKEEPRYRKRFKPKSASVKD
jgi:hypothetical protein